MFKGSYEYLERLEGKIRDGIFVLLKKIYNYIMLKYSKITVCHQTCTKPEVFIHI